MKRVEEWISESDKELFRKAVHMSAFFLVFLIMELLPGMWGTMAVLSGTAVYVAVEMMRIRDFRLPVLSVLVEQLSRKDEKGTIFMPTLYFLLAVCILATFFGKTSLYMGLAAVSFGDPAAYLVGSRYGRHKIVGKKSLEGSAAFFLVCFASFLVFVDWRTAALTSLFSTAVELVSGKYDNFTIPLSTLVRMVV